MWDGGAEHLRLGGACVAVEASFVDALRDGGEAEKREGLVVLQVRDAIAAYQLARPPIFGSITSYNMQV